MRSSPEAIGITVALCLSVLSPTELSRVTGMSDRFPRRSTRENCDNGQIGYQLISLPYWWRR
jgi:hypothetical protein